MNKIPIAFKKGTSYLAAMNALKSKEILFLCLIVVFAFFLRTIYAGVPALNGDEGDNFDAARILIEQGISPWQKFAGVLPPVSAWTVSFFIYFLGFEEWAIRFNGAVFGVLTIIAIFFLARLIFGSKVALLSSFIASVVPFLVLSSRDAHPDNPLILFSVLGVLFFEYGRKFGQKFWYCLGGMSFALAILSKYNAIVVFVVYFVFVLANSVSFSAKSFNSFFGQKFKNCMINFSISIIFVFLTVVFSLGFSLKNWFYFFNGVFYWSFTQNLLANVPRYYSFSVLFEGFSPLFFVLLPIFWLFLVFKKDKKSVLFLVLSFFLIIIASLQARKFPRHFLLGVPFSSILAGQALILFRQSFKNKFLSGFLIFLFCLSILGWSFYKVNAYQDYVVWRDVGAFVLSQSTNNTSVYVDGVEFWSVKFYTNYSRKIDSRLNFEKLNEGDIVIVHNLNKSKPFFIGSPLQNDLVLYSPRYSEQYEFNNEFYSDVRKYSSLLKSFNYDSSGNQILIYQVGKFLPKKAGIVSVRTVKLDLMTTKVCNIWNSNGRLKNVMLFLLSADLQFVVSQKCSKGCVYTCDFF